MVRKHWCAERMDIMFFCRLSDSSYPHFSSHRKPFCPSLISYGWKRVFALTSAFSWQNSVSLCPASFHTPRPNLPATPGVSWLPTFAFKSQKWKGHLFWVLVLEDLVGLHRTIQLPLLRHYWLGYRLGLPWYWMVCLGNKQIILSFLRFHPSTASWTLLLIMMAAPFLLRDSCPQ